MHPRFLPRRIPVLNTDLSSGRFSTHIEKGIEIHRTLLECLGAYLTWLGNKNVPIHPVFWRQFCSQVDAYKWKKLVIQLSALDPELLDRAVLQLEQIFSITHDTSPYEITENINTAISFNRSTLQGAQRLLNHWHAQMLQYARSTFIGHNPQGALIDIKIKAMLDAIEGVASSGNSKKPTILVPETRNMEQAVRDLLARL